MIVVLESLRLAFSSLRANPLRAALTVLGIMIGIASVVALTAIGTGLAWGVWIMLALFVVASSVQWLSVQPGARS